MDPEYLDAEHAEDGTPQDSPDTPTSTDDPETLAEHLRSYGVPDEIADSVKKGFLRQSDYTRKTQEVSKVMQSAQAIAQERDWLMSQLQQGGTGKGTEAPKSEIDSFFDKAGDAFENTPEMKDFLHDFAQAVARDVLKDVNGIVQPIARTTRDAEYEKVMSEYHTDLHEKYEGLDKHWPKVKAQVKRYLDQGIVREPEQVLWELDADAAADMRNKARQKNTRRQGETALEGFARFRRETPIQGSGTAADGQSQKRDMSNSAILKRVEARLARR